MEKHIEILGFLIFLIIGIFLFIIPTIKSARKILKHRTADNVLPIQANEKFALIVMPILGNLSLFLFREDAELLDWRYIIVIWVLTFVSIYFYFLSRTKKHTTGPLTLVAIPSALTMGTILALLQFVHFIPFFLIGGSFAASPLFFFSIFVFPAFSLIQVTILFAVELYCALQYNKNIVLNDINKNDLINGLATIYFGKYYLIAQVISFPIFITIVQYVFIIVTQKPDSIIQAFIESRDGLFSQGTCNICVSNSNPEYLCTIAAFGSDKIVKPLHYGYRQGNTIRVNRQLKICNAFEEMIAEKTPTIHKCLRAFYDGLQIPIEKWKKIKLVSNILYIIIKPMEWTFLLALYVFEKYPETKIGKQYLPINFSAVCQHQQTDRHFD